MWTRTRQTMTICPQWFARCGRVNTACLQTDKRMSITYCQINRHENVKPWPYAHNNFQHAAETTQLALQISKHRSMTYFHIYRHENVGPWPYAHNPFQDAAETTKLANSLANVSAMYMCLDCCCVSHTQSWLHINTYTRDIDVLDYQ